MPSYIFYISRVERDSSGAEAVGPFLDMESSFRGLHYLKLSGINSQGSPRVYEESFAEADGVSVYIPSDGVCDSSEISLSLLFLGGSGGTPESELYSQAQECFRSFLDYVTGHEVIYYDTARHRKVRMYLSSPVSPSRDTLHGVPCLVADFKFKNVYGRSFALDDAVFGPVSLQ